MNNRSVSRLVLDLSEVGAGDVELVGGKCASLGELFCCLAPRGVRAVDGFATTSDAYRLLLQSNGLERSLRELIGGLDYKDIDALSRAGHQARTLILEAELPRTLRNEIIDRLVGSKRRPTAALTRHIVLPDIQPEDISLSASRSLLRRRRVPKRPNEVQTVKVEVEL